MEATEVMCLYLCVCVSAGCGRDKRYKQLKRQITEMSSATTQKYIGLCRHNTCLTICKYIKLLMVNHVN